MRFMMMHKNDPHTEAGEKPPMELVEKMGQFIGGYAQSGRLIDGAGLGGSATRTRLTFRDGKGTVKRGPYRGDHELPAATMLLKVKTTEEAIGWAERYGKILGTGELELGKVNEPWDIGIGTAPPDPPLQVLMIEKADQASEGSARSVRQKAELTRLRTEMAKAGVLVGAVHQMLPSAQSKRLIFTNNDLRVLDGPFSESKELIGGFAVLDLSGMDEAMEVGRRYAAILGGTLEMDIRPLAEPEAAA